jgi:hypothetical protein
MPEDLALVGAEMLGNRRHAYRFALHCNVLEYFECKQYCLYTSGFFGFRHVGREFSESNQLGGVG